MSNASDKPEKLADLFVLIRSYLIGVGGFSLAINLLQLTAPLYMLQIYDRVLASRNELTLLMLTLLVAGLFLLMALLEFVRSRVLVRVGAVMESRINDRIFNAAFEASLTGGGGNARQALADLAQLRNFATGNGPFAFFDAPWFPVYLLVMFLLHAWIGWFGVIAALVLVALTVATEWATQEPLAEANRIAGEAVNFAHNSLGNAEVIEAMGMLPSLRDRWKDKHARYLVLQAMASDRAGLIGAATKFFRVTSQSLILGLGAYLAIYQELSAGAMIVGSILMGRALAPIDQLIANWRGFVQARLAYRRLNDLLTTFPARAETMPLPPPTGMVSVEAVTALPPGGQQPVLNGISFEIPAGTAVGIVGPTGAGKSSLARLLVGVWKPCLGKLRLDGADLASRDKALLGPYVGYLPQDIELFAGSVAENIARFGLVDSERVIDAARRAGLHETILRMPKGYDTEVGAGGTALSGGQRQRIGLARALYGPVRLVVLDEPNSNLDDAGETALVFALRQLKAAGCTVVLITHRTNVLAAVDRLMVLRDGALQAYGPREEVLAALSQAAQQARKQAAVATLAPVPEQAAATGGQS